MLNNKYNSGRYKPASKVALILSAILISSFALTGCSFESIINEVIEEVLLSDNPLDNGDYHNVQAVGSNNDTVNNLASDNQTDNPTGDISDATATAPVSSEAAEDIISANSLPDISSLKLLASDYDGTNDYIEINNNKPFFTSDDMTTKPYILLSELDELGRVGSAIMCAGPETITDEPRGDIGYIKPTGWMQHKYPNIVDEQPAMLYNRCHCLMYVMSGLNDEPRNLITGTRHLNAETMLEFEEGTVDYIERTGNHVIYRVTPVFVGDQLLCQGLLMEAKSVEDNGKYAFNIFCYNVQPGIEINYANGDSWSSKDYTAYLANDKTDEEAFRPDYDVEKNYVLNQGNHKVHTPDCEAVDTMNPKNKEAVHDSLHDLVDSGYIICGECN